MRLAGYRILELPDALVLHHSRPRGTWLFYYQIRNRWHFMLKNYQWRTLIASCRAWRSTSRCSSSCCTRRDTARVYWRAVGGLIAMLPELPRDRALIARIRRVPDARAAARATADRARRSAGRSCGSARAPTKACWRVLEPPAAHGAARMTPRPHPDAVLLPVVGGVESNAERLARYLARSTSPVRVLTKRLGASCPTPTGGTACAIRRIGPRGERSSCRQMADGAGRRSLARPPRARVRRRLLRGLPRGGVAALAARMLTGRPVVFQAQTTGVLSGDNVGAAAARVGVSPSGPIGRAMKAPIRALYGGADAFACISRDIEREALACGVPRDRV